MRLFILTFALCLISFAPAYAACTSPTGVAGSLDYDDSTHIRKICDGSAWKLLEQTDPATTGIGTMTQIANDTGSCTAAKTGRIRYNGTSTWEFCNGTGWTAMARESLGIGYLVETSTTFNGNLGGLTGANAKCLTDLTNNDWKWKDSAGPLIASRVKAFLCDSTTCNNLNVDTPYMLTTSGDATIGGVGFITDSTGRGPNHQFYNDSGGKIWRSAGVIWTNRSTISDEVWGLTPRAAGNANHCTNWSLTTGTGIKGNTGNDLRYRWDDGTASCATTNYLACIVNPPAEPLPCTTIGGICSGGIINAGTTPDGSVTMYTTPNDAPAGFYTWNKGTTNNPAISITNCTDGTTAASCRTGAANTNTLATTSDTASPYIAAKYCYDLVANGYSDWYLPARNELSVLYTNKAAIGGFKTATTDEWYWSSTPYSATYVWHQSLYDGTQNGSGAKDGALYVRCVRK